MDKNSPLPWSEADFMREIKGERTLWLTVRVEGVPLAFVVAEFMDDKIHIFKLSYASDYVADTMIRELKKKLSARRWKITCTVHEREVEKQVFLRRHKFVFVQALPLEDEKTYLFKFDGL
jgi:hypothetical protein